MDWSLPYIFLSACVSFSCRPIKTHLRNCTVETYGIFAFILKEGAKMCSLYLFLVCRLSWDMVQTITNSIKELKTSLEKRNVTELKMLTSLEERNVTELKMLTSLEERNVTKRKSLASLEERDVTEERKSAT